MKKFLFLVLIALASESLVLAWSVMAPYPFITPSSSGICYYKQVPALLDVDSNEEVYEKEAAYGIAYSLHPDGVERELWRTNGWYSFWVYVAEGCQHLVRLESSPDGAGLSVEDIAVAFYQDGNLLKQYSTADLVRDVSSVRLSPGGLTYSWQAVSDDYPKLDSERIFHLLTADNIHYEFDIRTGEIISTH